MADTILPGVRKNAADSIFSPTPIGFRLFDPLASVSSSLALVPTANPGLTATAPSSGKAWHIFHSNGYEPNSRAVEHHDSLRPAGEPGREPFSGRFQTWSEKVLPEESHKSKAVVTQAVLACPSGKAGSQFVSRN